MGSMTSTINEEKSADIILKTDVLGRVKTPVERREALLDEFEKSGMSGLEFARWAGVNYPTFATWIQKRRKKTGYYKSIRAKKTKNLKWLEAVVPSHGRGINRGTVIHFNGGIQVEAADTKGAIEILKEMGVKVC